MAAMDRGGASLIVRMILVGYFSSLCSKSHWCAETLGWSVSASTFTYRGARRATVCVCRTDNVLALHLDGPEKDKIAILT